MEQRPPAWLQTRSSSPQRSRIWQVLRPEWHPSRRRSFLRTVLLVAVFIIIFSLVHNLIVPIHHNTDAGLQADLPTISAEDESTQHIFQTSDPVATTRQPMSVRAYEAMSDDCVEEWVVHHVWGSRCSGTDLTEGLKVDGVWAWVNGSDPLQIASRRQYRPSENMKMDPTHRYVEHNELRYSMRSALASLGTNVMQRMHILASAYHLPNRSDSDMAGQVPSWLDKDAAIIGNKSVLLHHDANFFKPGVGDGIELSEEDISDWRKAVIPSFSSLAEESQIHNIDNTSSDQLIYYNDDFLTMRRLAVSDFTTPLFGPVIRTFTRMTSMYVPAENTFYRYTNPTGEEPGIKRAAWVLGQRFGLRPYYYITHHPRSLSLPLLLEAAQTFPDAFTNTALSRFRAQRDVPPQIQAVFLGSWYVVERHREALLWSWAVAKWGGKDGILTSTEKTLMWEELAGKPSPSSYGLKIGVPVRVPIERMDAFAKSDMDVPTSTEYSFSSKDGYALSYVNSMWFWNRPRHGYPDLSRGLAQSEVTTGSTKKTKFIKSPKHRAAQMCAIVHSECFGSLDADETASDFFKRIAFENPKCGDCIIPALIDASGVTGIHKFLPRHSSEPIYEDDDEGPARTVPPHLPLTSTWKTTNFSISDVIQPDTVGPSMTLRTWCGRLIQRYSYVLGSTGSEFFKVEREDSFVSKLDDMRRIAQQDVDSTTQYSFNEDSQFSEQENDTTMRDSGLQSPWNPEMGEGQGPLAFLCLNDDIKETGEARERVDQTYLDFFEEMWPEKMSFERDEND